jgi:hypothetical protein
MFQTYRIKGQTTYTLKQQRKLRTTVFKILFEHINHFPGEIHICTIQHLPQAKFPVYVNQITTTKPSG